jgi:myo-inositol 2-dehydrogenase/D-chiro-inositol 1-dehydrogenase
MHSLKTAIVGCGPRAYQHAAAARQGQLEILYACDPQKDRAERAASEWGARPAFDHRQVMDDRQVEAVIIATHVDGHLPVLEEALRAGKHVIVEKPLGSDIVKARELTARAEKSKSVVYISYQRRFDPRVAALRAASDLIDPVQVLCSECRGMMKPQFLNSTPFCGIMDVATHHMDLVSWFMKRPPEAVTAILRRNTFTRETGAADTLSAIIDYGDGRSAMVLDSIGAAEVGSQIEIIGSKGNVSLNAGGQMKGVRFEPFGCAGPKEPLDLKTGEEKGGDVALQSAFALAVREGTPSPAATLRDGLNAMLLILACHRSAQENRRVTLNEMQ